MKSESGLYGLLENILQESTQPLTCVEIFDRQEVKGLAKSPHRVSDYLGGLWRKGKVSRTPATRSSDNDGSRWAYSWRHRDDQPAVEPTHTVYDSKTLLDKPNILITHSDNTVTIDLLNFTITVKIK